MKPLDMAELAPPLPSLAGEPLRIGIIGVGQRGRSLLKHCLYSDLNVAITGICDVFDVHADTALAVERQAGHRPRRFRTQRELLDSETVDAVIIATPDHWHTPMALVAAQAKKHAYVEKCLGYRLADTLALHDAVARSPVVVQLGHQHRQSEAYLAARAVLRGHMLGHVRLAQAATHLNGQDGSWQPLVHPDADPRTVDWPLFLGNTPGGPFDAAQFFNWRNSWFYGAGLAGQAMAQDYDRLNGVLGLGIPSAVVASGGVYSYRDGRDVPDVFQVSMEFPDYRTSAGSEQGLSMVYSATLGTSHKRSTTLVGRDANLQWASRLVMEHTARPAGLRRAEPMVVYAPRLDVMKDASTLAPDDSRTWRAGHLYDTTYLHLREWLGCIRHGGATSCGIAQGVEEAITTHMATLAYRLGRRIEWDHQARRAKNVSRSELEILRLS